MVFNDQMSKHRYEIILGLWIIWLSCSMYATLLAIPLVMLLSIPLYFVIQSMKQQHKQSEIMKTIKSLFEQLAMETSSGIHFDNGLIQAIGDHFNRLSHHHPLYEAFAFANRRCQHRLMHYESLKELVRLLEMNDINDMIQLIEMTLSTGQQISETQTRMSQMISDTIRQQESILLILARKRMEMWIMSFVPGTALILVRMTSPDYLIALSESLLGWFLVSVSVLLMNFAIFVFTWNQSRILRSIL